MESELDFQEILRDAERYRMLRNGQNWPAVFADFDAPEPLRGPDLDAAVDPALHTRQLEELKKALAEERERIAAWVETQRNDVPATGQEFAAAIRGAGGKQTPPPTLGHAANGFICPWDSEGRVCSQHKKETT